MPPTATLPIVRFMRHVRVTPDCWLWTGAAFATAGYGMFRVDTNPNGGKRVVAHRFAYEAMVGPIPHGTILRHSCDNRLCVNPAHLIPGTHSENHADAVERGRGPGRRFDPNRCPNGHQRTPENTAVFTRRDGTALRFCVTCRAEKGFRHVPLGGHQRGPGRTWRTEAELAAQSA